MLSRTPLTRPLWLRVMYHARVRSASTLGTSYSAWAETGSAVQVNEALAFSAPALTNRVYTVNMAIAPVILPEATGGTGAISYTLTGPNGTDLSEVPGLTFTATNRQLSGTPTTAGTTTLTYTATDSATPTPVMVEREFTITINPDATSPTLDTAAVNGNTLTLTYDKALDGGSVPAGGDFTIGGVPSISVNTVAISGMTVTLTLSAAVTSGDTVTVTYRVPTTNRLQDAAGNAVCRLDG